MNKKIIYTTISNLCTCSTTGEVKQVKFLKLILISFIIVINVYALERDDKLYNYYEIKECSISIPKKYKLLRQYNEDEYKFTYTYILNDFIDFRSIDISNIKENTYSEIMGILNKGGILLFEKKMQNFTLLKLKFEDIEHYVVLGKKSYISFFGENSEDYINYVIDYCNKTRKEELNE